MSIILITSNHLRHKCFTKLMCDAMPVSLVIVENKPQNNDVMKEKEKEYFLLKKRIFSIPRNGCINIHTGLVQEFRGVDSSFWALNKELPEAVGATIHYINRGIDSGNIIFQTRPELDIKDTLEDIFLKTCLDSFEVLAKESVRILSGDIGGLPLTTKGRLYQTKDMNKFVYEETKNKLTKVLESYILDKGKRDKEIPLISCWT